MRGAFLIVAVIAVTGTANAQFLGNSRPTGEMSPERELEPVVPKSVLADPGAVRPPSPPPSSPLPSATGNVVTPGVRPPSLAIPPFD
jgi:hypothetical protein